MLSFAVELFLFETFVVIDNSHVGDFRQVAISNLSAFFSKKGLTADYCSLCVREQKTACTNCNFGLGAWRLFDDIETSKYCFGFCFELIAKWWKRL